MSRVPSIPYRVRVTYRAAVGRPTQPDQWHSFRTMAGALEYRTKMLGRPGVFKIETFVVIDETAPGIPQVEPDMRTQATQGSSDRKIVTHANRRS